MAVAAILLLAIAPLLLGLVILLQVFQGPEVIVRTPRLGQNRHPFYLYRFATHRRSDQLGYRHATPQPSRFGTFLCESGLELLPQLFNVLKGDMNILGPEPIRPALAQIELARDPLFGARFAVKPGLTGHTQALMGRGANSRVNGKLTYRLCHTAVNLPVELWLLAKIAFAGLKRTIGQIYVSRRKDRHLVRARRKAQDLHVELVTDRGAYPVYALGNELLTTPHAVTGGLAKIVFGAGKGTRQAQVELVRLSHLQGETVFQFLPAHENAGYLISRYLKEEPLVKPKRPTWRRPRLSDLQYELDLHVARETVPIDVPRR